MESHAIVPVSTLLVRRLTARGWTPAHVAEVGVWQPEASIARPWLERGARGTLVEPDPESAAKLRTAFAHRPDVVLHQVAIDEAPGRVWMYRRGASTFLASVDAPPATVNDGYQPRTEDAIEVAAVTFDQLDDGTIDLLAVDVEGAEWGVIRTLRSRPTVIAVETHGAAYRNPHLGEIHAWMRARGYVPWLMTWSDTVFVLPERIRPTPFDRVRLAVMRARLGLRAGRKGWKRGSMA